MSSVHVPRAHASNSEATVATKQSVRPLNETMPASVPAASVLSDVTNAWHATHKMFANSGAFC